MIKIDVIVIGAGAAGLMCAIEAAKRGRRVLVLDRANKPGKKILMSGGGRCNFTNTSVTADNYISNNRHFCKSALSRYTPNHFIDLVKKHQIPFHEKTAGQLFCDHKSKDILNMLLSECEQHGVTIQLKTEINTVQKKGKHFVLSTNTGQLTCESLVIATGGLSIPTMGSSPFGYQIAEQFGMKVWPTRAGLVPFTLHKHDKDKLAELSGISVDCHVSVKKKSFSESVLFTHRGLSGPAILQISSYWEPGESVKINFLPGKNIFECLKQAKQEMPSCILKKWLSSHLSKRQLAAWVMADYLEMRLADLSHSVLEEIAVSFNHWRVVPNGTEGYRTAEVTLGGVDCDGVSSKTFESRSVSGLYFIGEVLDVTGWLGGYNFQWAWASGFAAGGAA